MPDSHKNFAYSTVATAPSPATTGTSLVVAAGDGALFPTPPFNATIWPTGARPLASTAEIVRVTAIATDTLTITREQEGTTARTIVVGDQIAATITAKTLTDVEGNVSLLVAASDAPAAVIARADYVCDGTSDEVQIDAAIDALPAGGGKVQLSEGTFGLGAVLSVSSLGKPVTLAGAGKQLTSLVVEADIGSPIAISGTDGVVLRDFALDCQFSSFTTNANHAITVFDCSNFLAYGLKVTDWKNSGILIHSTDPNTDSNCIVDNCELDGLDAANNGILIVAMDWSGMRHCVAKNIRGASGPNYALQLKNSCRWCFIEDCLAEDAVAGIVFGRDAGAGVSLSRVSSVVLRSCDVSILTGFSDNNIISGVVLEHTTNVNDGIRLETSNENVVKGVVAKSVGGSRAIVRFNGTSTNNYVVVDVADSASAQAAAFVSSGPERNTVLIKKFGSSVPAAVVSDTSGVTTNACILGPGCTHSGTPTGHKWGIFNKEPVAQQANTVAARTVLENFGLLATGGTETATQADQETGTSTTTFVTPGRQHFHPSAAKFWVTATGNSTTILASYNMTSWADTGPGDADGTIATDFSTANWCGTASVMITGGSAWDATFTAGCGFDARAAGTFGVLCSKMQDGGTAAASLVDPTTWCVAGFGDHA